MRQVFVYLGEDGYWVAECPSLPEEAVSNIREAIDGYIVALKEDGLPVPEEYFETLTLAVV